MCVVDEARLVSGRYLTLSGWAMGKKGEAIVGIRAFADRQEVSESRVGLPRQDVRAAYPELSDFAPGFFLSVSLAHPPAAVVVIRLLLSTAKGTTEEFEVMYGFDPS